MAAVAPGAVDVIEGNTTDAWGALEQRLTEQAAALAAAQAHRAALARRGDPQRWRRSDLLWPLFAKG